MTLRFDKRTVTAFHISFDDQDAHVARIIAALGAATSHPQLLGGLLRRAMAETMLPAIREAYLRGLPKAVNMEVLQTDEMRMTSKVGKNGLSTYTGLDDLAIISNPRADPTKEQDTLRTIYERMRAAQMRGDPKRYAALQAKYDEHRQPFQKSLQRLAKNDRTKKSSHLSSGLFRERAMQVMSLFADAANLRPQANGNSVSVGIGPLQQLEDIRTPSATEYVLMHGPTKSPYNILWRHLEYGTGFYSAMPKRNTNYNENLKTGDGTWYYGKNPAHALLLRGSQGVHALYDSRGVVNKGREFVLLTEKYLGMLLDGRTK